jgi:hypothetical protein
LAARSIPGCSWVLEVGSRAFGTVVAQLFREKLEILLSAKFQDLEFCYWGAYKFSNRAYSSVDGFYFQTGVGPDDSPEDSIGLEY